MKQKQNYPTSANKSLVSISFCRQTLMPIPISFAPCSVILSISRGVTKAQSALFPLMTEALTTVGMPMEMTGTPSVFREISKR